MSKYLVTMTKGAMNMTFKGHNFRNDTDGCSNGRIEFITKICEFAGEQPTESEIKKVAGYRKGAFEEYYYSYHIMFMQKLEEE